MSIVTSSLPFPSNGSYLPMILNEKVDGVRTLHKKCWNYTRNLHTCTTQIIKHLSQHAIRMYVAASQQIRDALYVRFPVSFEYVSVHVSIRRILPSLQGPVVNVWGECKPTIAWRANAAPIHIHSWFTEIYLAIAAVPQRVDCRGCSDGTWMLPCFHLWLGPIAFVHNGLVRWEPVCVCVGGVWGCVCK